VLYNLPEGIITARDSVCCYVPNGSCGMVRIAKLWHTPDQIVENIHSALQSIILAFRKQWKDIQSLSIRTENSISFPFYYATEVKEDEVKVDEIKEDDIKEDDIKEDDIKEEEDEIKEEEDEIKEKEDEINEDEIKEDEINEDEDEINEDEIKVE